jgi:hypothetical protein
MLFILSTTETRARLSRTSDLIIWKTDRVSTIRQIKSEIHFYARSTASSQKSHYRPQVGLLLVRKNPFHDRIVSRAERFPGWFDSFVGRDFGIRGGAELVILGRVRDAQAGVWETEFCAVAVMVRSYSRGRRRGLRVRGCANQARLRLRLRMFPGR